ncbi:uncharacterized protein TNCV_3225111 [Trichonephila clavipes]|nr:uncharacterized protein TNCV_3225111 [Trichonephila clavipes]
MKVSQRFVSDRKEMKPQQKFIKTYHTIKWIGNKNVKELVLPSQADPKWKDQSSPIALNESKPKKLSIVERLQAFSSPETKPVKKELKKTFSDPETTSDKQQWTSWEETKSCLGRRVEIEETLLQSQRTSFGRRRVTKIDKSDNDLWAIEKIIRTEGRGTSRQLFVKWVGFDDSFNSWIKAEWLKT